MPAPKGNKNALGHDGSETGRKSAYEEKQDANFVADLWYVGKDIDALKERLRPVKGKKIAARDVFAFLVLTAMLPGRRETSLLKLADKLLPDKIDVSGGLTVNVLAYGGIPSAQLPSPSVSVTFSPGDGSGTEEGGPRLEPPQRQGENLSELHGKESV